MGQEIYGGADERATDLAKGVLLELFERFPELEKRSAVGGGIAVYEWVERPPDFAPLYTADVDLVVQLAVKDVYPDLQKRILAEAGYSPWTEETGIVPYSFRRLLGKESEVVRIDFQGPEVGGGRLPGGDEPLCRIGDLTARILTGGVLAVQESEPRRIEGILPGGGRKSGTVRIVKPFMLAMLKALAFECRGRKGTRVRHPSRKDAADLYALLKYSKGGPETLARMARTYSGRDVVREGVRVIERYFTTLQGEGVETLIRYFRDRPPRPVDQMARELVELAQAFLGEFRAR